MAYCECAGDIGKAFLAGKTGLTARYSNASEYGRVAFSANALCQFPGEIFALVESPVEAVPERYWHREDEIDFRGAESHIHGGFQPIGEIVAHPKMAVEFVVYDHSARGALEAQGVCDVIEIRAVAASAFAAEDIAVCGVNHPSAYSAATLERIEWDSHEAFGTYVAAYAIAWPRTHFAPPRPNHVKHRMGRSD